MAQSEASGDRWDAREEARTEFYRRLDQGANAESPEQAKAAYREARQVVKDFHSKWG